MKDINELMVDTKKLKEEFVERKLFLAGQLGVLDKKINSLIKENAYQGNIVGESEEEYALNLRNELKDLELQRREFKDEFKIFCDIDVDNRFTYNMLGFTINEYEKMTRAMKRLEMNSEIKFKNNKMKEYSIEGKDDEAINNFVIELKEEYSKVFVNKGEGKIYCYNNCRAV